MQWRKNEKFFHYTTFINFHHEKDEIENIFIVLNILLSIKNVKQFPIYTISHSQMHVTFFLILKLFW